MKVFMTSCPPLPKVPREEQCYPRLTSLWTVSSVCRQGFTVCTAPLCKLGKCPPLGRCHRTGHSLVQKEPLGEGKGRPPTSLSSGWILSPTHPWAGHLCAGPKAQELGGSGIPSLRPVGHLVPHSPLQPGHWLPHSSSLCPTPTPLPGSSVSPQHLFSRISQLYPSVFSTHTTRWRHFLVPSWGAELRKLISTHTRAHTHTR